MSAAHEKAHRHGSDKAKRVLGEKADKASDEAMMRRAVAEHEAHDHRGEPKTKLHLARGGRAKKVEGEASHKRLDRGSGKRMKRDMGGPTPGTAGMGSPQQPTPQQIQQALQMKAMQQGQGGGAPPMAKKGGRIHRAEGGRAAMKGKGKHGPTKINIVNMPSGGGDRPVPVPVPGRPPMAGPPPAAAGPPPGMPPRPMPPGMPPGGPVAGMGGAPGGPMPPGAMGMRRAGGRTRSTRA